MGGELGGASHSSKGFCSAQFNTGAPDREDRGANEAEGRERTNEVHSRRLCSTHSKILCSTEGCSTKAQTRGVCFKHGAQGKCIVDDCTANAQHKGGFCGRHGGRDGFCTKPGCDTPARSGKGVCDKHGAKGKCSVRDCSTNATSKGGFCTRHGGRDGFCTTPGCATPARPGKGVRVLLCWKHGGSMHPCSVAGCTTNAAARGVCSKHGGSRYGKCIVSDCSSNAVKLGGFCARHGGRDGGCTAPGRDLGGETSTGRSTSPSSLSETSDRSASSSFEVVPRTHWQPPPIGLSNGNAFIVGKEAGKELENGSSRSRTTPKQNTYAYDSGIKQEAESRTSSRDSDGEMSTGSSLPSLLSETSVATSGSSASSSFEMVPPPLIDSNGNDFKVKQEAERGVKKEEDIFFEVHPTCSKPGCSVKYIWWRHRNGRCVKHGPKAPCSTDGCDTNARSRGRCAKHGAYGNCSSPGCQSNALVRGLCKTHGAHGICSVKDCTSNAKSTGGRCHKHGANGACSVDGCTTSAITRKRGLCSKHGAQGVCSAPGCKTNARARGVCSVHSALGKCWCGAKGFCTKHGRLRESVKSEPLLDAGGAVASGTTSEEKTDDDALGSLMTLAMRRGSQLMMELLLNAGANIEAPVGTDQCKPPLLEQLD